MNEHQLTDIRDRRQEIGHRGELYALNFEHRRLSGHPLIDRVQIVGQEDIGLGYDIASFESVDSKVIDRYIEVKTFSGEPHFFLSGGEQAAAEKHTHHYYIYLIDIDHCQDDNYKPTIIRDPLNNLNDDTLWKQKQQTIEYILKANEPTVQVPDDFFESIVMVGCFNNEVHKKWILHSHHYNVRAQVVGRDVNGAVHINETTMGVRYMVLYNVQQPREHAVYKVKECREATGGDLIMMGYRNPHCPKYVLYHLEKKVDMPAVDVMQLLRTNNDKVVRRSGTPVYMLGSHLKAYIPALAESSGMVSPKRGYSNVGKPWTQTQNIKLMDWIAEGRDVAYIAQKLYRSTEEIHRQMEGLIHNA